MARVSQADQIALKNERQALEFFKETLGGLPDPRRAQGVRYPLRSVVVTALMAMVCGCDDAEAMEAWGRTNANWLSEFLPLPHGTPSQDVFLGVFAALEPKAFGEVLRSWAALLTTRIVAMGDKHIAVDGKTSRRSFDSASARPALHTVSAFLSGAGLVLGQTKTLDKSNEITAIPELLQLLDLHGATITIDAIGCQTAIATTIVDGGGDYLLAVKDNQPTLRRDIEATFVEASDDRGRSFDELPRPAVEVFEEVEKEHGRVEKRTIKSCCNLSWMTTAKCWDGLSFIVQVTRERTNLTTQKTSVESAYYIGSRKGEEPSKIADAIRRHWSIENELHWVLDMAFREDEARHRARNTAQNMTILRHFALNIVKNDTRRKLGVANSRKRAGWDRSYLLELLKGAAC